MNRPGTKTIVLLGMMSKIPVAGVVWQTVHYLVGLQRLGYDVFYVEAHARTPAMLMRREDDDASALAASFIDRVMRRFGLGDRWAFHALHADGRCYGLSEGRLRNVYRSAALLINLHGGTEPLPEHIETGRLIYLETDPVELQLELYEGRQEAIDFLSVHSALFTFAENYGNQDCRLPVSDRFTFRPTRQPVVIDLWEPHGRESAAWFTTVGNWRQPWRMARYMGETYSWSKHHEFLKFISLPRRTAQSLELALSGLNAADRQLLESNGWAVRDALRLSSNPDTYRTFVAGSRGEFTVAKDQNIRFRTGWFSDRSATYLAAGRPVVTQETGFSNVLPVGRGLFAFSTLDEVVESIDRVNADYQAHRRAAAAVAREFFAHDVVLSALLQEAGLERPRPARTGASLVEPARTAPFPPDLVLQPISRWPTTLPQKTVDTVLTQPIPWRRWNDDDTDVQASVVVVTCANVVFVRMCLESLLANTLEPRFEVVVVDNGSADATPSYLQTVAGLHPNVRVLFQERNLGFAPAANIGMAAARGDCLVLLNDDTIVPPGWLGTLLLHLEDRSIGLIGPVTNRAAGQAQVEAGYRTYGEMVAFAGKRSLTYSGQRREMPALVMFCAALRREVYARVGNLDERFEVGMFEDDDYSLRVRRAGYQVMCAEDSFVHHFGQATIGKLAATRAYGRQFHANRCRFEEKWGLQWEPHSRRTDNGYERLVTEVRRLAEAAVPAGATVLVVSKGDNELVRLNGRVGWHFPQVEGGGYTGHHPADGHDAIRHLQDLASRGAGYLIFPRTAFWWLDHYAQLARHLETSCSVVLRDQSCLIYKL